MVAPGKQNLAGLIARIWDAVYRNVRGIFVHIRFQIWALWAIGPVFVLIYGAQLASILSSAWPMSLRGEQLRYVGVGSWVSLGIIAVSVVLMANVIRKASVKIGAAEIEVETTTTVTNTPAEDKPDGTDDP